MSLHNCRQKSLPFRALLLLFLACFILSTAACHRSLTKAKKTKPETEKTETSLSDIDGNTYPVLLIGEQLWMTENLRVSHYNDGTPIHAGSGMSSLEGTQSGAWVWYDNDESNDETYGKLYNYNAVLEGNICPEGWYVPTDEDWQQLMATAGEDVLKTAFSNQHGGFFNPQDISPYSDAGKTAYWWSSTSIGRNTAASFVSHSDASRVERHGADEGIFYSVRCIRN